jgi:hypothetical protein
MNIEIEISPSLQRIEDAFCGRIDITHQFKGIKFHESGLMRLGSVFGFIMGLKLAGQVEEADSLATSFLKRLDYLSNYGGTTDLEYVHGTTTVPSYIVRMGDDGMANSFTLCWYRLRGAVEYNTPPENRTIDVGSFPTRRYDYAFNGGMIFHGFNRETFSVNLSSDGNPWGIHT